MDIDELVNCYICKKQLKKYIAYPFYVSRTNKRYVCNLCRCMSARNATFNPKTRKWTGERKVTYVKKRAVRPPNYNVQQREDDYRYSKRPMSWEKVVDYFSE